MRLPPRRDVDAGGMSRRHDKFLQAARSLRATDAPTAAELSLARHMSHADASWPAIHAALGWDCRIETTIRCLKKFNIFSRVDGRARGRHYRYGGSPRIPRNGNLDIRTWKPSKVAK